MADSYAPRAYYAQRRLGAALPPLDYPGLRRLLLKVLNEYEDAGWFQAKLGKDCVDDAADVGARYLEALGRDLYPFSKVSEREDDGSLLSLIEFLYDSVAKPTSSRFHGYMGCGLHVQDADTEAGRAEFLPRVNALLARYQAPLVLRPEGEIWELPPIGMEDVVPEPTGDSSIDDRVASARRAFLLRGATRDDKRHAILDLAAVLERHRDLVKEQLLKGDEAAIFNIANNYGLRHHNEKQKVDYSDEFMDWIFYNYLNLIRLLTRIVNRMKPQPARPPAAHVPPWAIAEADLPF